MATIKLCSDLQQSRKLAEILPLESADMYYKYALPKSDRIIHTPEIGNPIESLKWYNEGYTFSGKREPITLSEYCISCWSLAALLDILPNENMLVKTTGCEYYCLTKDVMTEHYDNPIDACYEMIIKLHELKML